jgi:hypothetical protein
MQITKQMFKKQFGSAELKKRVKKRLSDVSRDCQTGIISELIYHCDCKKFFTQFIEDISELIVDLETNIGMPIANKQGLQIYTFYAWLAYEETACRINIYNTHYKKRRRNKGA